MVNLNGHETGNSGYCQGEPKATAPVLYSTEGRMKGKLLSLFTIIDARDHRELNEGALQRFLAEVVWFPTALLPSQGVTWTVLDNHKAKATITDSDITTSLEFEFNEKGEVVSVYTPSRYREVSGKYEPTP